MLLAKRMRKFRKAKKMSQEDLARIVGVDASTICNYENKDIKNPSLTLVRRIEKAIGVKKGFFFE